MTFKRCFYYLLFPFVCLIGIISLFAGFLAAFLYVVVEEFEDYFKKEELERS